MNPNDLSVVQLNLRKSITAVNELKVYLSKKTADIILLQEPYNFCNRPVFDLRSRIFCCDTGVNYTASVIINQSLVADKLDEYTNNYMTTISIRTSTTTIYIINVYIHPNGLTSEKLYLLEAALNRLQNFPVVMCGDFNSRNPLWFDAVLNSNGRKLAALVDDHHLSIHNLRSPTCRDRSIIDLTLTNRYAADHVRNWRLEQIAHISDHKAVLFQIDPAETFASSARFSTWKFNEKVDDWGPFCEALQQELVRSRRPAGAEALCAYLSKSMTEAAYRSLKVRKLSSKYRIGWWNSDLEFLMRRFHAARNLHYRGRRNGIVYIDEEDYRRIRKEFQKEVRRAKRLSWSIFIEEVDNNSAFGNTYRLIKTKIKPASFDLPFLDVPTVVLEQSMNALLDAVFPTDFSSDDDSDHRLVRDYEMRLTNNETVTTSAAEVEAIIDSLNMKKAPGLDFISNRMIKKAAPCIIDCLVELINLCLSQGVYPELWKQSSVVMLKKLGKPDYNNPKAYRPICLTSNLNKVLEKVIQRRLVDFYLSSDLFSSAQHGFIRQKSTITALRELTDEIVQKKQTHKTALVAVDISGAFDNAWHPKIVQLLDQHNAPAQLINVIRSYLSGRSVRFTHGGRSVTKSVNHGAPQGGVFSPFLWNVLLNDFLINFDLHYARAVAYADDISFVVWASDIVVLKSRIEHCMRMVVTWCQSVKLTLSAEKTGLLYFHSDTKIPVEVAGKLIQPTETIKVLGVTMKNHRKKDKIDFSPHVVQVLEKTTRLRNAIFAYCARTWGINNNKRIVLYKTVVRPVMAYACSIWYPHLTKRDKKKLDSAQYQILTRCVSAYKTTSSPIVHQLAGTPFFSDYMEYLSLRSTTEEPAASDFLYDLCRSYHLKSNATFQSFFPSVIPPFIIPNKFTTLFLSGTGPFLHFLYKISATDSEICDCGQGQPETSIHLLTSCSKTQNIIHSHFGYIPLPYTYVENTSNYLLFTEICKSIYFTFLVNRVN